MASRADTEPQKRVKPWDAFCASFLAFAFLWNRLLQNSWLALVFFLLGGGGWVLSPFIWKTMVVFSFWFIKPFRENILVLLTLSYPLSSWSYLSSSLLLSFKHISTTSPFQPNFLLSGAFWIFCCCCPDYCCVCVFFLIFSFFACVGCFALRLWQLTPFSLQFWGFQRGVVIYDTEKLQKVFPAIRAKFPPRPFLKKTLWVCHLFLFVFFVLRSSLSTFHVSFVLHQPLLRECYRFYIWLNLCCPLLVFVCASFLQTSFLTSPWSSRIHLAFIFGRLALLFFIFECYCFQAWCFIVCFSCWFLFVFLLTVVVTFLFNTGNCLLCFSFGCFFVKFLLRLLFWFQIMT